MPQLDTSTWFTTIISMFLTLFIMIQLKIANHSYPLTPQIKSTKSDKPKSPWNKQWTKIYLPLSLPLQ
uniref:ATP synthase complex subunit 8 n=1 Tax=Ratufa bicolor melanopepla TaxID=1966382 RepID=A0A343CXS8_RATBI|nr:ATP synthase F0 subunit 8 [Ratufa bicolor melanopepla]